MNNLLRFFGMIFVVNCYLFIPSSLSAQVSFSPLNQFLTANPQAEHQFFDNHSAVYLDGNDKISSYGDEPINAYCNYMASNLLYSDCPSFNSVETLFINVNSSDEETAINLEKLVYFQHLKYIIVSYTYNICPDNDDCLSSHVKTLFTGSESSVTVLYQISIAN